MKFTFTSEFIGFGSPKNTMEFEVDHIGDVINYFEQFLKGSGYHFDGHLDIVEDIELSGCCGGCEEEGPTLDSLNNIRPVTSIDEKCTVRGCGLTRQQLGDHTCYDSNCGFKN